MARNEISATKLLSVIQDLNADSDEIMDTVRKASAVFAGDSKDLREAQRAAILLARDMTELAAKLYTAVSTAETEEKIAKLRG